MTITATPYGQDTSCLDYLRPGRLVSGGELLGQAAYRRLITERGSLEDDQSYGFALSGRLGSEMTEVALAALPALIRNELLKDERLESVEVNVTVTRSVSSAVSLAIDIAGVGVNGETFSLVLAASEVAVELLNLDGG